MNTKRGLYSVWNNKTDELVACARDYQACAKAMGIRPENFHRQYMRSRDGEVQKWTIIKEDDLEEDLEA